LRSSSASTIGVFGGCITCFASLSYLSLRRPEWSPSSSCLLRRRSALAHSQPRRRSSRPRPSTRLSSFGVVTTIAGTLRPGEGPAGTGAASRGGAGSAGAAPPAGMAGIIATSASIATCTLTGTSTSIGPSTGRRLIAPVTAPTGQATAAPIAPVTAPTGQATAAPIAPVAAARGQATAAPIAPVAARIAVEATAAKERVAGATADRSDRDRSRRTAFLIVARQAAGL
jgi:hypothetical protein